MAQITLEYDGRNTAVKKLIDVLVYLGAKVVKQNEIKKCGLDEALEDVENGRIREIKDTKMYFKNLGINV